MKVDMEVIEMVKTLSEFWNEVASICYDSSDYGIIAQVRSQFRTNTSFAGFIFYAKNIINAPIIAIIKPTTFSPKAPSF